MKSFAIVVILVFRFISTSAQDVTGKWNGVLQTGAGDLRLVLHISKTSSGFKSTLDSPDQGAFGIPATKTTFEGSHLQLEVAALKVEYNGILKGDRISGNFKQAGRELSLDLVRGVNKALIRPQEPKAPYPYYTEDVSFKNTAADISLDGTLSLPKATGKFPVVILISGSGPQNRDGELLGHKPFLVISDYLVKNGIAVLRFDDRGVGKSQGNFQKAIIEDFTSDVECAIAYLKKRKEIDSNKIGLVGHSEGGIIAPSVAAKTSDVNFMILLAAPGIPGYELMLLQKARIESQMGLPAAAVEEGQALLRGAYDIILSSKSEDSGLENKLNTYFKTTQVSALLESQSSSIVNQLVNPWFIGLLKQNPAQTLEQIRCPVLALNGGKDLQVPAMENLAGIKNALVKGGNKNVTVKEFPALNHLFQECKTCSVSEYRDIEETFSPMVLEEMVKWIILQTDKN